MIILRNKTFSKKDKNMTAKTAGDIIDNSVNPAVALGIAGASVGKLLSMRNQYKKAMKRAGEFGKTIDQNGNFIREEFAKRVNENPLEFKTEVIRRALHSPKTKKAGKIGLGLGIAGGVGLGIAKTIHNNKEHKK